MVPSKIHFFHRYRDIVPHFDGFLDALTQPPPVYLRINTLKISPKDFAALMEDRGYDGMPVGGLEEAFCLNRGDSPGSGIEYSLGYYHVQGLTSMLPAKILDPRAGETILDLCAAPGGKATHVAQLVQNHGLVVANDPRIERATILRSHIDRLGTTSVLVTRYHGQAFPGRIRFQRIMVDPPCSAEGTYRAGGRPPLTEEPGAVGRLAGLQRKILCRALDILEPGGTLVYSTCTYAPEENEAVIDEVASTGKAEILPIRISFPHSSGLTSWGGKTFHPDLIKTVRFYPHQVNSWGFFIAHLRKPV
jgi:tRNA (cytosine49-C5)-methyltransferase